jgi:hypothetical protein
VRDISNQGVCLAVSAQVDTALHDAQELVLSLYLAQGAQPRSIACAVRRRAADGDLICYGCEFDWAATTDADAALAELMRFVVERFVHDLRVSPDRRSAT